MSILFTVNLSFSYRKEIAFFKDINLKFNKRDFVSIIGRNGSGKSTFVKLIAGLLRNYSGNIMLHNKNISEYRRKEFATILSYLPQYGIPVFRGLKIKDFLLLGRYSYKDFYDYSYSKEDKEVVDYTLDLLGLKDLQNKFLDEISGGELQKVLITLSLVQLNPLTELENKILIIDEPLTFLDISHSIEIFSLLKKLNEEKKLTIIIITHDLNLALRYTGKTILLDNGKIVAYGNTSDVINEDILRKHFLIDSQLININNYSQIYYNSIIKN